MRLLPGTVYLFGFACAILGQSDHGAAGRTAADPEQPTKSKAVGAGLGSKNSQDGTTTETKQLYIHSAPGFRIVHPGQRIALVLDIDLKPRMHVYATGAGQYIPVQWTIEKTAAFRPQPPLYPPALQLYLKPIQETVPVYPSRFRVVQKITIGSDDQVRSGLNPEGDLLIAGNLQYQACDDRMCYFPQTTPIRWTFHYQGQHARHAADGHPN